MNFSKTSLYQCTMTVIVVMLSSCSTEPSAQKNDVNEQIDEAFNLLEENRKRKDLLDAKMDSLKNIKSEDTYSFDKEPLPAYDINSLNTSDIEFEIMM
ncbi:MAG: hypothetical protein ACI837_001404 [Crocinitomicaceae bacterium]|jgi:hypothetical protein